MVHAVSLKFFLVRLLILFGYAQTQTPPQSPCQNIFRYVRDASGKWYGLITAPNPYPKVTMHTIVSLYITVRVTPSTIARLQLVNPNTPEALEAGDRSPVKYRMDFVLPSPLPTIKDITVNGKIICTGTEPSTKFYTMTTENEILSKDWELEETGGGGYPPMMQSSKPPSGGDHPSYMQSSQFPPVSYFTEAPDRGKPPSTQSFQPPENLVDPPYVQSSQPPPKQEPGNNAECGKAVTQPTPLIVHGQNASRGQFPWHAAIFLFKEFNLTYICGGCLIAPKTVITAGHCGAERHRNKEINRDILRIFFGKYHLQPLTEDGEQVKRVEKIILHPQYNGSNLRNDVSILILSSPVEYTMYVRPICLWNKEDSELSNVIGKVGMIPGWGYDQTGKLTEKLMIAKMPIVSQLDCWKRNIDFYVRFTSENTFCAGYQNGTSVCNGDSGGGMVFPKNETDGSVTWMLRGLVSLSKPKLMEAVCDPMFYIVFTDITKYRDWIDSHTK